MIDKDDISRKTLSLEKLKQAVIVNYLDEVDTDNVIDLYDKVINHFMNSDLDKYYDSKVFDNMDAKSKSNVLEIVHKYQGLCFYENNPDYWIDSVESISIENPDLITYQILDHFEFLIKLFLTGGESALEQLSKFSDCNYRNKQLSTVEDIRRRFVNDETLFNVFKLMSSDNSLYDIYTDEEKNILLDNAEGVLYFFGNDGIVITDPLFLAMELYYRMSGETYNITGRDSFIKVSSELTSFFKNEDGFYDIVTDMFYEYYKKYEQENGVYFISDKVADSINKEVLRDKWIVQDEALLLDVNTPLNQFNKMLK